jgi:hypothetical protein
MLFPRLPFPTPEQEFEACFTIVLRNLKPENWNELIDKAQVQMIREIKNLLHSRFLSLTQAIQMLDHLQRLEQFFTLEQRNLLAQILLAWHPDHRFNAEQIEKNVNLFLGKRTVQASVSEFRDEMHWIKFAG